MSRSAAEPRARAERRTRPRSAALRIATAAGAAIALLAATAAPLAAQSTTNAQAFELTRGTQRALARLQESWLQWVGAAYRDNDRKAEEALAAIEANARLVGMTRLVDFSLGATAIARAAARDGDEARVAFALAAAERLDPGRPETEFARASIRFHSGSPLAAVAATFRGFARLLQVRERVVVAADLVFWLVATLLLAGALYVLVQVAAKGSAVVADLRRWLRRRLSSGTLWLVAAVLLLWPLVLPGGPLWLLLYWSALLWGYSNRGERAVTVAIWLVAATGPLLAARAIDRVALDLSPPMRAVASFAEGRLYGGFFADLDVLRSATGESAAGKEFLADVHRTLGQWELARTLYRQVQEAEPKNAPVLLNLGAYQFRKSDFALANEYFQQAAASAPDAAAAYYDLSLSYSETYQFDESRRALSRARELDGDRVDAWLKSPAADRVLTFNGALARLPELAAQLREARAAGTRVAGDSPRRAAAYGLAGVGLFAALALGLGFVRRPGGYSEPEPWLGWRAGAVSRWVRAFLPALSQAELGEGGKAIGSLVALSAILLLPRLFTLAIDVPVLGGIPAFGPWILAGAGFALYLVVCLRSELGEGK